MRFFVTVILCFSVALATGPEFSLTTDDAIVEQLNEVFAGTDTIETVQEEDEINQLVEKDVRVREDISTETTNKVIEAQWDITPPKYSVKKKALPKPGKILDAKVLSREYKRETIKAHNLARSIAVPSSSDMRKMTWDNSLEKLATKYSRRCIYEHNPNPVHRRFQQVGENLFVSKGYTYNKTLLAYAVRRWDDEKVDYDYEKITCQSKKVCGHYTQVVWAESFKVGCGVTRCGNIDVRGKIWKNAILFVCNYGPAGNYRNERPYKRGNWCGQCDCTDACKRKLCSNPIRDRSFFDPKMAKWSPWAKWSTCSANCGKGNRIRERTCSTFVSTDCKGYMGEVMPCTGKSCRKRGQ